MWSMTLMTVFLIQSFIYYTIPMSSWQVFFSYCRYTLLSFCIFIFSDIDQNNFNFKIFKAGILILELRLPLLAFSMSVTNRRRSRATAEEDSVVSTPSRNTRNASRGRGGRFISPPAAAEENVSSSSTTAVVAAAATEPAECAVCTNSRNADVQRFCQQCNKMLCVICCERMQQEALFNYFNCPFCNCQFVADVIDLFSDWCYLASLFALRLLLLFNFNLIFEFSLLSVLVI